MIASSNNSLHYIKNWIYYDDIKKVERFASPLPTPVRAFVRRKVLERRYELLLEIVKLSLEITSLSRKQTNISKVWYDIPSWCGPIPYLSAQNKLCDRKNWEPQNKRVLLLFKRIELN